ncbi:hypothetical protein KIPE111705_22760 [Kibdelosporangium persicum]|uniref:Tachylectin n=1 Tax=Kibdelosporangium persicum TaxID=2698649 RepID=A0ABX2FE48_9PSEU|nr:hypothetical protein [Kibdelosporangium persicum]
MRLMRIMAAVTLATATFVGVAAPSAVAQPESPMVTDGDSFLEINNSGQLVRWTRYFDTFSGQLRGTGWEGSRAITSLTSDAFVEIKPDHQLAKWTWRLGQWHQQIAGSGWQNARLITGIGRDRFIEVNTAGELVLWEFNLADQLTRWAIGSGWNNAKAIVGLGDMDFLEIHSDGSVSEWIDHGDGFREYPLPGLDLSDARLIAGLDRRGFIVVSASTGELLEYVYDPNHGYVPRRRGVGWQGARLIG